MRVGLRLPAGLRADRRPPPRRGARNPNGDSADEQRWMAEAVRQVTDSTFFKRYGTIDEQVGPILFLASDEASYITGTIVDVAGGR